METFDDIEKMGWSRVIDPKTNRKIYVRPNKTKVRQMRDLSENEKIVMGNILFPPRQTQPENQSQAYPEPPSGHPAAASSIPCSESPPTQSGRAASSSLSRPSSGASSSSVFSLTPQETHTPEVKTQSVHIF